MTKEISNEQMYELVNRKLFLPEAIFLLNELEELYHTITGKYIPSSFNLKKAIKRVYENNHQDVLKKILIAIAERGIKEFKIQQDNYPSLRDDIEKRVNELNEFIKTLKDC